jgi:hypothetical protein
MCEPTARLLHDSWQSSVFTHLCFERRHWVLRQKRVPPADEWRTMQQAFERFPLQRRPPNATANRPHSCEPGNLTFIADLRHAGTGPPGIAHFSKRILKLWALQRQQPSLPPVTQIAFPATTAVQLRSNWLRSMLQLIAPNARLIPSDNLLRKGPASCFSHVVGAAKTNTYFTRPEDANALRARVYEHAQIRAERAPCVPLCACYFRRAEGVKNGKWEGGPRTIANRAAVMALMAQLLRSAAPGGHVREVSANSSHSFAQQAALFASCDLLVSVHGSHNANVMWMRPGASFMELNPYQFYYSSYEHLAHVVGLRYVPSRSNSVAMHLLGPKDAAKARTFVRTYGAWSDVRCQGVGRCRQQARSFPTLVNMTDFTAEFTAAVASLVERWPCARGKRS